MHAHKICNNGNRGFFRKLYFENELHRVLGEGIKLSKKTVSGLMLTLLFIGTLTLAFNIEPVKSTWTGTVYIRADGSIDPPDAPISTVDNVTYVFTDNVFGQIVVERSNIIIDGAGYTLHNVELDTRGGGFTLRSIHNVTIQKTNIKGGSCGIYLWESSNIIISWNNITNFSWYGIVLARSCNNIIISENDIKDGVSMGSGIGLYYSSSNNSILRNNIANNNYDGIFLREASFNTILRNNLMNNGHRGIDLERSSNNVLSQNYITNNGWASGIWAGIALFFSSNDNNISGNNIINNSYGISLDEASNNYIYHNNFIDNVQQVYDYSWDYPVSPSLNNWDDGYPSGGNYWSDYNGTDLYSGPYQNETGSDGIGDTPYVIDENNVDHYPLMKPWIPLINATVDIIPNTLNMRGKLQYVTAYIELPEGYNVSDINVSSILLNNTIPVDPNAPIAIGDYDNDTIPDLMVKFNGTEVIEYILNNINVTKLVEERFLTITLTLTGKLKDGTQFKGSDTIRITMPTPRRIGRHIFPI